MPSFFFITGHVALQLGWNRLKCGLIRLTFLYNLTHSFFFSCTSYAGECSVYSKLCMLLIENAVIAFILDCAIWVSRYFERLLADACEVRRHWFGWPFGLLTQSGGFYALIFISHFSSVNKTLFFISSQNLFSCLETWLTVCVCVCLCTREYVPRTVTVIFFSLSGINPMNTSQTNKMPRHSISYSTFY